jgi:hypothetical protein
MEPTREELLARIAELEAKTRKTAAGHLKIAPKGGISMYNLGRYPVTLYASQWQTLIERVPQLQAFLVAEKGNYKEKEEA